MIIQGFKDWTPRKLALSYIDINEKALNMIDNYVTIPQRKTDNPDKIKTDNLLREWRFQHQGRVTCKERNLSHPRIGELTIKFAHLCHTLIEKAKTNQYMDFSMPSVFMDKTYGVLYANMLRILQYHNLITIRRERITDRDGNPIGEPYMIKCWYTIVNPKDIVNIKVNRNDFMQIEKKYQKIIKVGYNYSDEEYKEILRQYPCFKKLKSQEIASQIKLKKYYEKELPPHFYENYTGALLKLKYDEEMLDDFVRVQGERNQNTYNKHKFIVMSLKTVPMHIFCDSAKNGRIYTPFCTIPRALRSAFNLKFEVDISNCHPLLYNNIICKERNITNYVEIFRYIDDAIVSACCLKDNAKTSIIDGMKIYNMDSFWSQMEERFQQPSDLLKYMYLTSKGLWWDYVMETIHSNVTRDEIKVRYCSEVLYSKTPDVVYDDNIVKDYMFNNFPTIMAMICKSQKEKGETSLANELMSEESKIIKKILCALYEQGYVVINIHDGIFVLDVRKNNSLTPENIISMFNDLITKNNMVGDVKVEKFEGISSKNSKSKSI